VRITSEPHAPLMLKVVLPIALRDAGLQQDQRIESSARPAVLIADDNQISLRVLSSILSRAEFESVTVCSGQAAIEALAHRNFDLVLLDLAMPGMDGDVTTDRIRQLPNCTGIPIVGITAGVTEKLRESCRRNGMDAILGKPIDAEELVASVHFHLSRASSRKRYDRLI
jgi:CheY-like chemotaxis protein